MKKYRIKNADGSEQTVMQAVHESREEAEEALLIYLCGHNEKCDDDSYLSPFNFTVEEVEVKDVNEVITDFKSARQSLGLNPNEFTLSGYFNKFGNVVRISPKHIGALIALNELFTIAEAWNKEDGFVPDFSVWTQDKWFPWFVYDKDAGWFEYAGTNHTPTYATAFIGSRLCFKTSERAAQFGRQFAGLYNKVFL